MTPINLINFMHYQFLPLITINILAPQSLMQDAVDLVRTASIVEQTFKDLATSENQ